MVLGDDLGFAHHAATVGAGVRKGGLKNLIDLVRAGG